jgi:hypothetical protein
MLVRNISGEQEAKKAKTMVDLLEEEREVHNRANQVLDGLFFCFPHFLL